VTKPEITMSAQETAGRSAEIATALDLLFASGRRGDKHLLAAREGIGDTRGQVDRADAIIHIACPSPLKLRRASCLAPFKN